jgi:hypothetical protein
MTSEQTRPGDRPEGMNDLEWLVAIEEIRQLKARRDRYVDAHDWEGYASLHAPDHVSHHAADPVSGMSAEPWTSVEQMIESIRRQMPPEFLTVHHSYDPEFLFETPKRAKAIWAMTAAGVLRREDAEPGWNISYGYYYETYEKRDGRWLFTSRRWERYLGIASNEDGGVSVHTPPERLRGANAFEQFG